MTKEQIRKAAKDVADKVCNATDCIEWENLVFAFEDGELEMEIFVSVLTAVLNTNG